MHGEMRIGIARAQSARLRVNELAVVREPAELLRLDRDAPQRIDQPELGQLAAAVRQQVDADAARPDRARALIDSHATIDALVVDGERGGETTDADPQRGGCPEAPPPGPTTRHS